MNSKQQLVELYEDLQEVLVNVTRLKTENAQLKERVAFLERLLTKQAGE